KPLLLSVLQISLRFPPFFVSDTKMYHYDHDHSDRDAYHDNKSQHKIRKYCILKVYHRGAKKIKQRMHGHRREETVITPCQVSQQESENCRIDSLNDVHMEKPEKDSLNKISHDKGSAAPPQILHDQTSEDRLFHQWRQDQRGDHPHCGILCHS